MLHSCITCFKEAAGNLEHCRLIAHDSRGRKNRGEIQLAQTTRFNLALPHKTGPLTVTSPNHKAKHKTRALPGASSLAQQHIDLIGPVSQSAITKRSATLPYKSIVMQQGSPAQLSCTKG